MTLSDAMTPMTNTITFPSQAERDAPDPFAKCATLKLVSNFGEYGTKLLAG